MSENGVEAAKADLRKAAHQRRAAMPTERRVLASQAACRAFLSEIVFDPGEVVAFYWPIRDEIDCQPLLIHFMDHGQPVCLPAVLGPAEPLEMRLWEEGEPLYPAGFGTLAPSELAPKVEPDVLVMPLLGFDKAGTRLGYGGGYYDRTLAALARRPRLIGLAFSIQEIDEIPRQDHDVPLDAVVTENGARHFQGSAATQ